MEALRRLPLEGAIRIAIPTTIVAVALGSNASPTVRSLAQPGWRLCLVALCGLAVAYAAANATPGRIKRMLLTPPFALAAAFLAFAALSALWSADLRVTAERTVAFGLVVVSSSALALGAAGDRQRVERLLVAVLAGPTAVAALGLAVLAILPHEALQEATRTIPTRYRGVGQNPNTVAMLLAVALPLATWLVVSTRVSRRPWALLVVALLAASITGSGSRGALGAGAAGSLVVLLAAARSGRERLLAVAVVVVVAAAAVGLAQIPQPDPDKAGVGAAGCVRCGANDAETAYRLDDELDGPSGAADSQSGRTLFSSSGRFDAWRGAIRQAAERPVAGYGFGTEDRVFVDRYYWFFGGSAENSYIGTLLQLGLVGLGLLVALALALLRAAAAPLRRPDLRTVGAACAAVVVTGLVVAAVQSYIYAAGNNATLTVWLSAFLGSALVQRKPTP